MLLTHARSDDCATSKSIDAQVFGASFFYKSKELDALQRLAPAEQSCYAYMAKLSHAALAQSLRGEGFPNDLPKAFAHLGGVHSSSLQCVPLKPAHLAQACTASPAHPLLPACTNRWPGSQAHMLIHPLYDTLCPCLLQAWM